jgi:PIN domain nuclease of toxin-antitoxin system
MKLLLDTHTFIWWSNEPEKLSENALTACQDESNTLILSVELIKTQREANGLKVLPVELAHVLSLSNLPSHHKDPFDRLLIAQAKVEVAEVVSVDPVFSSYGIKVLW